MSGHVLERRFVLKASAFNPQLPLEGLPSMFSTNQPGKERRHYRSNSSGGPSAGGIGSQAS
jgi:hypothetical protein